MSKKIKIILSLAILTILLTGCNRQVFDFKHTYDKAICNYDGNQFELKIDKWADYDGEQLQILSDGKTYLISANKCYLVEE